MGLFNFIKKIVTPTGTHHDVDAKKLTEHVLRPISPLPDPRREISRDQSRIRHTAPPVRSLPNNLPANLDESEYRHPLELIRTGSPIVFITGKAGTGKTIFINYLRHKLPDKRMAVLAYTGAAAVNCEGSTLHSFFRFPILPFLGPQDVPRAIENNDPQRPYAHLDIIIIDEASMLRADMFDAIEAFMSKHGPHPGQLFGGVQVVLIGDLFQLAPIARTHQEKALFGIIGDPEIPARYRSQYFFSANGLNRLSCHTLKKTHRQDAIDFITNLDSIRTGQNLEAAISYFNTNCRITSAPPENSTILTSRNDEANQINEEKLSSLPGTIKVFRGLSDGSFRNIDEADLPAPLNLRLKVGARVLFVKNDPDRRWINGSRGTVIEFLNNSIVVQLDSGNRAEVKTVTWEKYSIYYDRDSDKVEQICTGSFTQYPLKLGWAFTTFKAQGMTLDKAHILPEGLFAFGQLYVALSRVRTVQGISLSRPLRVGDIKTNTAIQRFYEGFGD